MNTMLRLIFLFLLAPAFAIVLQAVDSIQDDFRIVDSVFESESVILESANSRICNYDSSGRLLRQRKSIDERAASEGDPSEYGKLKSTGAGWPLFSFSVEFVAPNTGPLKNRSGSLDEMSNSARTGGKPAPKLSASQQRGIRSLEKQIEQHQAKLDDFKRNPTVRPGMENLPADVIKKQQQARIRHLETEIGTFKNNIQKIRNGEL
ncbi:MAG: hypothetical protein AAGB19_16460 [Cyanobacteria bacterium P01_F01_bin.3]